MTHARPRFGGLLRSEALKAATMPATYGLLAAILAMTAINTALPLSDLHANLAVVQTVRHALEAGRDFAVLFVALGAVGAATEFRHRTAIPTLLATPRRDRLVGAKIATYLCLGLLAALAAAVVQLAIVLPWAAANGHALAPWDPAVLDPVLAGAAAGASYAALGVAIGLLVRNQLVALMIAVGWFTVAENALAILVPGVSRFLPGGALSGVDTHGLHLLPLYAALPLLAGWVVAISTLALRTTLRKDIA
jgi:ABC-2 type transport system permease protein